MTRGFFSRESARRLFVSDGRIRTLWRILLYVGFLIVALQVAGFIVRLLPFEVSPLTRNALAGLLAGLAAGWLALRSFDDRGFGALGFALTPRTGGELLRGFAIGMAGLLAAALLAFTTGALGYRPEPGTAVAVIGSFGAAFALFALGAAFEEVIFRGYAFQALVQGIGPWLATLLLSGLFALAHAQNPNVGALALVNIFLAGVLLSAAYLKTRSLWFVTALHLAWNWTQASLLDLPVSGLSFIDTPAYEPVIRGPAWWDGGAFGPEAGLTGTIAILLMLALVWRWRAVKETDEMRAFRPLIDER